MLDKITFLKEQVSGEEIDPSRLFLSTTKAAIVAAVTNKNIDKYLIIISYWLSIDAKDHDMV